MIKTAPIPNAAIRSSLFTVKALPCNRPNVSRIVECQKGYSMRALGEELNQYDALVFQSCIWNMKKLNKVPGDLIVISSKDLVDPFKTGCGGSQYKRVWESLIRMKSVELVLELKGEIYIGNIFSTIKRFPNHKKGIGYEFNRTFTEFIVGSDFTYTNITEKAGIAGELGKWLYDFLSSHQLGSTNVTIQYLKRLSGSTSSDTEFKRMLKRGLEAVLEREGGNVRSYEINGNSVLFNKPVQVIGSENPFR
jgi:hypothetical protein